MLLLALVGCGFDTDPAPVPWRDERPDRPATGHPALPLSAHVTSLGRVAAGTTRPPEPPAEDTDAPAALAPDAGAGEPEDAAAPQDAAAPEDAAPGWGECERGIVCWLNPVGREHCSVTDDTLLCRVDGDCLADELCAPEGRCAKRCSPGL